MPKKKIFLASSAELAADRDAFEMMVRRQNDQWERRGYEFDVVRWENFVDSMSRDGLQQEYNKAVRGCDIFVMLFFTKVGPFTREEFEVAFEHLAAGSGPRIYTYFRNDHILTGDIDEGIKSLLDFKAMLKARKHYITHYANKEDLLFQFSRQMELLYGGDGADLDDIDERMPQVKAGELALTLAYRQLFGDTALDAIRAERLRASLEFATRQVRETVLFMATQRRRETWFAEKRQMERTIPIFEALVRTDPNWHAAHGQLGYALVERLEPEWRRAKQSLDRAVTLRGDDAAQGLYYHYNRARCAVRMDPAFPSQPADAATRDGVLEVIRQARRDLDTDWERLLGQPDSADIRQWLQLNGSPRLR